MYDAGKILGAEDPGGSKGLLKWKGVMFAPDDGIDKTENKEEKPTSAAARIKNVEQGSEVRFSFNESQRSIIDIESIYLRVKYVILCYSVIEWKTQGKILSIEISCLKQV